MVTCIKPSNSDREPITTSIGYGFTAWAFLDSWTFLDEACKRIKNAAQTPYTSIGTHTVPFPVRTRNRQVPVISLQCTKRGTRIHTSLEV